MSTQETTLNIEAVMRHLPHRYPFLLVDRVLSVTPGESLIALKNVTINEPQFTGHFPQQPVMPGVLLIEALAQASGILTFITAGELPTSDSLFFLGGIDKARFKQVVEPGDSVTLSVELLKNKRGFWKFSTEALVDGNVVCSAEIMNVKKDINS